MNTFQEPYCRQAELLAEANAVNEFSNIKEKFVIDGNADYPEPEYLIRIGDVPTLPKGNLVAVSAKWKNGKTFFCDILKINPYVRTNGRTKQCYWWCSQQKGYHLFY